MKARGGPIHIPFLNSIGSFLHGDTMPFKGVGIINNDEFGRRRPRPCFYNPRTLYYTSGTALLQLPPELHVWDPSVNAMRTFSWKRLPK